MSGRTRDAGTALAMAAAAAAVSVPAAWMALAGCDAGRAAWDAAVYHERVIHGFIESFPRIDASDPLTTTTPGYHLLAASFGVAISDEPLALRLLGVAIAGALLGLVAGWCARRRGAIDGLLLALPLAASPYVLGAASWNVPDDLGWLLVATTVGACLRSRGTARDAARCGAALLALVLVRQVHAWAAAPVALACLWPDGRTTRRVRMLHAASAVLPAAAAVAAFVAAWRGLVPPRFQSDVSGWNPATPAFIALQFGAFGLAFLPWLWPAIRELWLRHRGLLLASAAAGLALAALPSTTTDQAAGRYSGFWGPLATVPTVLGRTNPAFLLACPAGMVAVVAALRRLEPRPAWILAASLLGFTLAMTATAYSWQRYHEPFVLLALAGLAAMQPGAAARPRARAACIALAAAALAAASWKSFSGPPVDRSEQPSARHLHPGERFPAIPGVRDQSNTVPSAAAAGGQ